MHPLDWISRPAVRGAVVGLCLAPWAWAADAPAPATPRFAEETDVAGLQSRFEGEGEYMVGGGVATVGASPSSLKPVRITRTSRPTPGTSSNCATRPRPAI